MTHFEKLHAHIISWGRDAKEAVLKDAAILDLNDQE